MNSYRTPILRSLRFAFPLAASVFLLSACGTEEKATSATSESDEAAVATHPKIAPVILTEKPEGSQTVLELRKAGKPGDEVTVTGKIGGAMKPFTEGFATFVLADTSLRTCDLIPEDGCKTPWDACCADPEMINASRITVQILDGDSGPVAVSLHQMEGLSELDQLVVMGQVAEGSSAENLILNASGIFLEKNWTAPVSEEKEKG